ncbi:DNA/RNA endonuclease (plasmid) [Piscirickettsia salmonis]|uniref:DNA/RNA non-specific endonuclease n=2 Tax=Piscirickettsia salmonis TaxID=1238 RepID=UPI0002F5F22F|nr:DNA/RNA non-specific endonuclease [Piscirickettsia salmonis]ALA26532.1 DNA/RNA non-specific endonuclease family protein [Piscirickettsia salmonis]APS49298.1 DNA/RNA endonuclease [Piscirickettsia salmonis]APS52506.1 DNA/RNA endonuclease [Piscirickettsia salmonis]APS55745.1 DNA/RNA endonuclease [Piscirickettsia salmonis]APS59057.1 DNA/RNA endonuclease [Piscirickettsia salmonis]
MKKTNIILCGLFISLFSISLSAAIPAETEFHCHGFMKYGIPGKADQYLCREGYSVGYNYKTKQPRWVAYHLTSKSVSKRIKRHDDFRPDPAIPYQYQAQLSDYKRSGYDRGHLAPYAAMDFDKNSASQSFLLSNMSPQKAGLNRQGWAKLESNVRFWAKYKSEVYVYTGPIFQGKNIKTIGKNKVAVPTAFFKIIFAPQQKQALAFVMPNKRVAKNKVSEYRTNIAHIEKLTGLKFLSQLTSSEREKLVIKTDTMWRTRYN